MKVIVVIDKKSLKTCVFESIEAFINNDLDIDVPEQCLNYNNQSDIIFNNNNCIIQKKYVF